MKEQSFQPIIFQQLMTTPFRAETSMPRNLLPIYSALTPPAPPYTPFRRISYYPDYYHTVVKTGFSAQKPILVERG